MDENMNAEIMSTMTFDNFPDELIMEVFLKLDSSALLNVSYVCRRWYAIATSCAAKHNISHKDFSTPEKCLDFLARFKTCNSLDIFIGEESSVYSAIVPLCTSGGTTITAALDNCTICHLKMSTRIALQQKGRQLMKEGRCHVKGLRTLSVHHFYDDFHDNDSFTASIILSSANSIEKLEVIQESNNRMYPSIRFAVQLFCENVTDLRIPILDLFLLQLLPNVTRVAVDVYGRLFQEDIDQLQAVLTKPRIDIKDVAIYGNYCTVNDDPNVILKICGDFFPRMEILEIQGTCWKLSCIEELVKRMGDSLHLSMYV